MKVIQHSSDRESKSGVRYMESIAPNSGAPLNDYSAAVIGFVSNTRKKYQVVPRDGRFLVVMKLAHSSDYTVLDDCRTERFANLRAEALNGGVILA